MIRVIVSETGLSRGGETPYRIEGQSSNHGIPITGQSAVDPLLAACRILARQGEPLDHLIGVYREGKLAGPEWAMRTTVGYGSRYDPVSRVLHRPPMRYSGEAATPTAGLDAGVPTEDDMGKYREFPGGPIKETPEPGGLIKDTDPYNAEQPRATSAPPATPAAPPPPPHKPPAHPAGKHPAHAKPAKSEKSHHSPKPKGSGGRRGRSLAR